MYYNYSPTAQHKFSSDLGSSHDLHGRIRLRRGGGVTGHVALSPRYTLMLHGHSMDAVAVL